MSEVVLPAAVCRDYALAMRWIVIALFLVAGLINFVPIAGAISTDRLTDLYGIAIAGPDLEILMRHRAIVLGTTGLLLIAAAFREDWRLIATLIGLASMLSFEGIVASVGEPNANLSRIARADLVGIAALAAGFALDRRTRSAGQPSASSG